jgi:hypothetical protein
MTAVVLSFDSRASFPSENIDAFAQNWKMRMRLVTAYALAVGLGAGVGVLAAVGETKSPAEDAILVDASPTFDLTPRPTMAEGPNSEFEPQIHIAPAPLPIGASYLQSRSE